MKASDHLQAESAEKGWKRYRGAGLPLPDVAIREALEPEASQVGADNIKVETLARFVDLLERIAASQRSARRSLRSDVRTEALAEVSAIEASRDQDVREFRASYFPDGLLESDSVYQWLRDSHARDYREPQGFAPDYGSLTFDNRLIIYQKDTTLAALALQVHHLSYRYGWDVTDAIRFLCAGVTPRLPFGYEIFNNPHFTDLPRIVMEVPIMYGASEVADLYAEARKEAWGWQGHGRERGRKVNAATAQRAVFAARHAGTGTSLAKAQDLWIEEHPEQAPRSIPNFAKSLREAYRQVTWRTLRWQDGSSGQGATGGGES